MKWGDIGKGLAKAGLGIVGTALGGPAGGIVGGLVASALGLSGDEATPEDVGRVLATATPEQKVKYLEAIRRLENENAADIRRAHLRAQELALAKEEARLKDVADARSTEVARYREVGRWANVPQHLLSLVVVAGFFWAFSSVSGEHPPEGQAAMLMVGGLISAFTQIVQYQFGSSRGSREKDERVGALGALAGKFLKR